MEPKRHAVRCKDIGYPIVYVSLTAAKNGAERLEKAGFKDISIHPVLSFRLETTGYTGAASAGIGGVFTNQYDEKIVLGDAV